MTERYCLGCDAPLADTDATKDHCHLCRSTPGLWFGFEEYPVTRESINHLIKGKVAHAKARRNLAKAMANLLSACAQVADLMETRGFVCNAFERAQKEARKALAAEMGGSDDEQSHAPTSVR